MDKFVVKQKRNLQNSDARPTKKKQLTQSTLQSLAGVVVLEEFESAKSILESDDESIDTKIGVLNKLLEKNPSKEVLIKVGIGRTVRLLSKGNESCDQDVLKLRKISDKVYRKWRNELERKVELKCNPVDVKCDKETERLRNSAIKFLTSALRSRAEVSTQPGEYKIVSERLEQEIFRQSSKLVNNKYRKLSRKVIFALKSESNRGDVLSQRVCLKQFVSRLNSSS